MKVLVGDDKTILAVVDDSHTVPNNINVVKIPLIEAKLNKAIVVTHKKHGTNEMEETLFTRNVGLKEAPAEWTLDDVLTEKYKILANGKMFWYDQFLTADSIDSSSVVSTGFLGVSIAPSKSLIFKPVTLVKKVKEIKTYIESDYLNNLSVIIISDDKEVPVVAGLAKVPTTDKITVKITNNNEEGLSIPIWAFAIFY